MWGSCTAGKASVMKVLRKVSAQVQSCRPSAIGAAVQSPASISSCDGRNYHAAVHATQMVASVTTAHSVINEQGLVSCRCDLASPVHNRSRRCPPPRLWTACGGAVFGGRHFAHSSQLHDDGCEKLPSLKHSPWQQYLEARDSDTREILAKDFLIYEDFISEAEEESLFAEVEPYLKRLRYETDHWDDAIHGYRETERKQWSQKNQHILQRVRDVAFPPGTSQLTYVHVLDLLGTGCIKAHIDSVRFCGSTIAGVSLLSSSVMRLVHEQNKDSQADALLKRRSLYIMKGRARYEFTHEVLGDDKSVFQGDEVPRARRISVICRNEPSAQETDGKS